MKLFLINVFVLLGLLLSVEIAGRAYYAATNEEASFFREQLFVSPWFTTLNRPAPIFEADTAALSGVFAHQSVPTMADKPDNVLRVIAMGGSTTHNQTAWRRAKSDYAAELQAKLKPLFPNHEIEVFNAGGEAFSSAHSLVNYALRISAFKPDLIIVMHNSNDRSVAYFGEMTLPDYANKYMHPTYLAPETQRFNGAYGVLVQSRVLSGLGAAKALAVRELNFDAEVSEARTFFARNMRNLAVVAAADKTDVLFLSQPYDPMRITSQLKSHQELFNNTVATIASETGTGYVDMHGLLGGRAELFVDTTHYSVDGVVAFADALAPAVAERLAQRLNTR